MSLLSMLFDRDTIDNLSPEEFKTRLESEKDAVLIDVRTEAEHNQLRIPNSKLIDIHSHSFQEKLEELDKTKSYFVYCHSGNRSYYAAKAMKKLGFEKVYNLSTGISGWRGPVEQ